MSNYPDFPGARSIDTSIAAAKAIGDQLGALQLLTLGAIHVSGTGGLTTHEIANNLNIDRAAIQPRTSELRHKGKIIDSGNRRPNASGRLAIVWVACPAGEIVT